jgi:hypothetical protein
MKSILIKILILSFIVLITGACNKTPETEIGEAIAILDSVKLTKQNDTGYNEIREIEDSIYLVLESIEEERSKLIFRKYKHYSLQLEKLIYRTNQLRHDTIVHSGNMK